MTFHALYEAGFVTTIPITPPDCPLAPGTKLRPQDRGKVPGLRNGTTDWWGFDWIKHETAPADLDKWTAIGAGVGLRTKDFPAVDVDVLDERLSALVQALVQERLGWAPRRVGRAPKVVLAYRTAEPFKRRRLWFRVPGMAKRQLVEVLGDGQQYVVEGLHAELRRPYVWDIELEAVGAAGLTLIDRDQVEGMLGALRELLEREGCTEIELEGSGAAKGPAPPQEELTAPWEQVVEAVGRLPNTNAHFPSRTDYLTVGYAIKAAVGERGRELFLDWAEKWEGNADFPHGNSVEDVDSDWSRMKPPFQVGAPYLFELAQRLGGYRWAAEEFADIAEPMPEGGVEPGYGIVENTDLSQDALALEMGVRWKSEARYVALWGSWLFWDGQRWLRDEKLAHMTRCRAFLRAKALKLEEKAEERKAALALAGQREAEGLTGAEADKRLARAEKEGRAAEARASGQGQVLCSAMNINAVATLARSNAELVGTVDQWDRDKLLLGTPGGVVDLRTGRLRPGQQTDYITKQTAVAPAPEGTKAPIWEKFLARIFKGRPEVIPFMQRVAGYSITGSVEEHALVFAWGQGGNGKGVLWNTLGRAMGDYSKVAPTDLLLVAQGDKHTTEMAMMRGARLVTASELAPGKAWDEPKLKSLTGGDPITARFMRQDFFTFEPQFTLVVFGNHKPSFRSVDEAIKRRVLLVPFLENIPADERDPDLPVKLQAEWPAILRWAIDGCLEWQRIGLAPPATIKEASKDYLESEDALGQWLYERCVTTEKTAETGVTALYTNWQAWCGVRGMRVCTLMAFSRQLSERGYLSEKTREGRFFIGISLNSENSDNSFPAVASDFSAQKTPGEALGVIL